MLHQDELKRGQDMFGSKKNEDRRKKMNPGHVDEALWEKAKKAVIKTYGKIKWPVVMSVYEKMGGK